MKQNEIAAAPVPLTPRVRQDGLPEGMPAKPASRGRAGPYDIGSRTAASALPQADTSSGAQDLLIPATEQKKAATSADPQIDTLGAPAESLAALDEDEGDKSDKADRSEKSDKSDDGDKSISLWKRLLLGVKELKNPEGRAEDDQMLLDESAAAAMALPLLIDMGEPDGLAGKPGKSAGKKKSNLIGGFASADGEGGNLIMESGDKIHRIAVVAHTVNPELRPPKMKKSGAIPAAKPKSRAECKRRCDAHGFCDPSNVLGCGGEFCGKKDMLY